MSAIVAPPREKHIIKFQEGTQTKFGSSAADIVFFGGSAGGSKSYGLLLDAVRHFRKNGYNAVIFRKTSPEITNAGGLWDSSQDIYPWLGGIPREGVHDWSWPKYNSNISFSHFQHVKHRRAWQGAQVPYIGFDEITQFEKEIFWWMNSRNRDPMGVIKPCIRATCNPEPGSWVADFLDWWIGKDGFPIEERDGVLRWFVRNGDRVMWFDRPEDVPDYDPKNSPRSVTFIRSRLTDNKILMERDPSYKSTLLSLPLYERMILLDGNWKVKRGGGMRFKRHWFEIIDECPPLERSIRYWDRASTEKSESNKNPDWTAGVKLGESRTHGIIVTDVRRFQYTPAKVIAAIKNTAIQDGSPDDCELWLEKDPGQAGVSERDNLAKELAEWGPRFKRPDGSKWMRSAPASAASENGLIKILKGPWNKEFLDELDGFVDEKYIDPPPGYHDDQVDGFTGAFNRISRRSEPGIG